MKLLFIFLFTLNISFANQDTLLIFCHMQASQKQLLKSLNSFASREDKVLKGNGACVEVFTKASKEDLFTRIMNLKYPGINIRSTAAMPSDARTCRIIVETVKTKKLKSNDIRLSRWSKISTSDEKNNSSEVAQLMITNGKSGSISANGSTYTLTCKYINKNLYELTINGNSREEKNLRARTNNISTTVNLSSGSRIEIGSILRNLNNDQKSIGIPSGFKNKKDRGFENIKTYLSIKQI